MWDSRLVIEGSKRPTCASMEKWTLNGNDDDDDDEHIHYVLRKLTIPQSL